MVGAVPVPVSAAPLAGTRSPAFRQYSLHRPTPTARSGAAAALLQRSAARWQRSGSTLATQRSTLATQRSTVAPLRSTVATLRQTGAGFTAQAEPLLAQGHSYEALVEFVAANGKCRLDLDCMQARTQSTQHAAHRTARTATTGAALTDATARCCGPMGLPIATVLLVVVPHCATDCSMWASVR
jgi:hypothetical protein